MIPQTKWVFNKQNEYLYCLGSCIHISVIPKSFEICLKYLRLHLKYNTLMWSKYPKYGSYCDTLWKAWITHPWESKWCLNMIITFMSDCHLGILFSERLFLNKFDTANYYIMVCNVIEIIRCNSFKSVWWIDKPLILVQQTIALSV